MAALAGTLRLLWLGMLAALAGVAALPALAGPAQAAWSEARVLVLTLVLTLLAMAAGVGSLSLREALVQDVASGSVDPESAEGAAHVERLMLRTWVLCLLVGMLGLVAAWTSADATRVLPFVVAASGLLLFHAPHRVPRERS